MYESNRNKRKRKSQNYHDNLNVAKKRKLNANDTITTIAYKHSFEISCRTSRKLEDENMFKNLKKFVQQGE